MDSWRLAIRFARRELRAGLSGFRLFMACLALGVAAIAGVQSISAAVEAGLVSQGRTILGGDVSLRLVHRSASAEQLDFLAGSGSVSQSIQLRAMVRQADEATADTGNRVLVEAKAVDDRYPLVGGVRLAGDGALPAALAERDGVWGAVLDQTILDRLGAEVGSRLRLGTADIEVRDTIEAEPDRNTGGLMLGPRLLTARGAIAASGLIQPGSLAHYHYRIALPEGTNAEAWAAALGERFPDAGWRVRTVRDASPGLRRVMDRVTLYLTLVGLTALLVGGVGVANAVKSYLDGRAATIATLKCLGAPGALVVQIYLVQIMILAAVGVAIGATLGSFAPAVASSALEQYLPVPLELAVYPGALILAAAFGLLTALAFSLWPLARAREISAAGLFRDLVAPADSRPRRIYMLATFGAVAALGLLAVATAADRGFALWFVAAAIAIMAAFRAAGWGLSVLARRIGASPRVRGTAGLRLALANMHRPGAPMPIVVLSLGLGLTVLVAVASIEGNLSRAVEGDLPDQAPAYFFIDIQPSQLAAFESAVAGVPGSGAIKQVPTVRGRVVRLAGKPVAEVSIAPQVQWIARGDRALTAAAAAPEGSRIVAGEWWAADYDGPPLVSFDAEGARGMGLEIGDTVTLNVLGREITATIANLREIDWSTFALNFVFVLSPGALQGAPYTHIASVEATPAAENRLVQAVTDDLANVTAIRVRDALDQVNAILAQVRTAVRTTALLTVISGTLVLAGAVAAGHRRRVYESVILKVLGATRRQITRAYLAEFALLGIATAFVACVVGSLAGWVVVTQLMRIDWFLLAGPMATTALLCTALTLGSGLIGTWWALGRKAAPLLRNEVNDLSCLAAPARSPTRPPTGSCAHGWPGGGASRRRWRQRVEARRRRNS